MSYSADKRLLIKAARLYYEEGATQAQAAQKLGVSRSLISKLLTEARELGIVQITVTGDDEHPYQRLEDAIEEKYHIREAICVPYAGETAKREAGKATANYLLRVVKEESVVGMSAGTTVYEVANAIPEQLGYRSLTFFPMVGGMGDTRLDIHANSIVTTIAQRLHTKTMMLHAPVIVDTVEAREVFLRQKSIKRVFDLAKRCDIAIVGIGGRSQESTMVRAYLEDTDVEMPIDNSEIVGDICYNFIDGEGRASNHPWNQRILAISLEDLKTIPLVIGVAVGPIKTPAIQAALENQLIDVLITDYETGEKML